MLTIILSCFSLILYSSIIFLVRSGFLKKNFGFSAKKPIFYFWLLWNIFLILLIPLSFHENDMFIWINSLERIIKSKPLYAPYSLLPHGYAYLPIYAIFLASLVLPFNLLGFKTPLFYVFVVKIVVISAYFISPGLMANFLGKKKPFLASIAIILAPVTIFYLIFGKNNIVMWILFLTSLIFLKRRGWFWSGFFASLGTYKFLLIPTVIVQFFIVSKKAKEKGVLFFTLGFLTAFLPNIAYFISDPSFLIKIIEEKGAIGGHCQHVDVHHFLYLLDHLWPKFSYWYINLKSWFYLSILGLLLSLIFYYKKRLNGLQSLGFASAFVALFSLEPFNLETTIGLFWLDALYRRDLLNQKLIFVIILIHFVLNYEYIINSEYLSFNPQFFLLPWRARGFYLGSSIIILLIFILFNKKPRKDFLFKNN